MDEEQCAQSRNVTNIESVNSLDDNEEGFINIPNVGSGFETSTEENFTISSKRVSSDVWNHFDKVIIGGENKAKCKYCSKILCATSKNGTSSLKKHFEQSCKKKGLQKVGQSKLQFKTNVDGTTTLQLKEKYKVFDQTVSRYKLVTMVVLHEYPLSIVDHFGFKDFILSINPTFKMISRNTLRSDVFKMYNEDKLTLKRVLGHNDSRIAVTTDMWTASNQKKGYMVVTSHFIDASWILRNRTLRFCFVPCPHTKGVLAKVLMDCLSQYCLESKISSVVLDNCTTNDAMMKILVKNFEKKDLMLGGVFLHFRCSAHILNLIVQDGLEVIHSGIVKVRDCVSFWMSTPKRIEKFEEANRFLGNSCSRKLVLDCKTRWNSTFYMLQSALPYMDVFDRLKRLNKRLKFDIPSNEDWMLASLVCKKLEIFDNTTKVFSERQNPTSNLFFRKACVIKLKLKSWLLDDNEIIKSMAKKMIEKFDKYWEHINGPLAIAGILDPRNKMDCMQYFFGRLYGDDSERQVERVRKVLNDLVVEYQQKSEGTKEREIVKGKGKRMYSTIYEVDDEEDEYAQSKKSKMQDVDVRSELEEYLGSRTEQENSNFDVLAWWKNNNNFPTLRAIAKDVLAIPISSVASESAFSMGGRVISPHRSRLHANTVEALMCLQNWKLQDLQGNFQDANACSTINEDKDVEEGVIDIIDMDVDDIPTEDMEEDDD